jgi:aflatoxin B1 aldehyde reductase
MKLALPRAYLGTMTFAWSSQTSSIVDESVAEAMVKRFCEFNSKLGRSVPLIDTARVYAGGDTEPMLGKVIQKIVPHSGKIGVGTKAHPSVQQGLSKKGIRQQLGVSLNKMHLPRVGEYYLHQPDTENSLLESLKCVHELVLEGKISDIGISNYHSSEVARAFALCKEYDLTLPSVYQGIYNPLNRLVEDELLPILKENGCSFVAYNPLAAGLLSGKHKNANEFTQGRFINNENYIPRFYTHANFQALELIRKQCEKDGISMIEATYLWILKHSSLTSHDGLLVGASSLRQLDQNLAAYLTAVDKDNLSNELLAVFEECWSLTKPGAFPYWRSYSADMPQRDNLDPGASYNAEKSKFDLD